MIFGYTVPQAAKALVALLGAVVTLLLSANTEFAGFIPENVQGYVAYGAAALTAVATFLVKNADTLDVLSKRPE